MTRSRALVALCVLGVAALGCGGRYPGPTTPAGAAPGGARGGEAALGPGGLAKAALPYVVLDGRTGHQLEEAAFWPRLARARAICIGEEHPNPHHHWVQLHAVEMLAKAIAKGDPLAVGLEMVQRPFQGVLDDYAAKRIDAAALRSRTGWAERWGYDFGFYGPTLDAAVARGAQLLALNAPRELTKKVSRKGLEALTADERAQVPELKLDDPRHRAWFDALMSELGGAHAHMEARGGQAGASKPAEGAPAGGERAGDEPAADPRAADPHAAPAAPSAERIYTVQVLWDETMADGGARWLAANPRGRLIVLAGNGHCHDSAIVGRLKRRGVTDAVSIRPVIDAEGSVADALAKPMNDFLVVMQLPK